MSSHRNGQTRYGSDFGRLESNVTTVWRKIVPVFMMAMLCLPVVGCNVIRVTLNTTLTPEDVAFIVPGHTTLAEIVDKLGTPDTLTNSETGVVATYRFLDMKYSRVNFGWLAKPWTPVDPDLIFSRTGFGVDAFEVHCDQQWVVLHQVFQRHLIRPPFHPYPFQQSRVSPQNELLLPPGPAIMASHDPETIRSATQ